MGLDDILRAAASRVETVRVVRTALNPLLWLVGIVCSLALTLSIAVGDPMLRLLSFGLAAATVVVAIVAYFILLFRDPDRLQSEEYRLQQRALQILYKQGGGAEIVDVAKEIARTESLQGGFGSGDKQ